MLLCMGLRARRPAYEARAPAIGRTSSLRCLTDVDAEKHLETRCQVGESGNPNARRTVGVESGPRAYP